MVSPSSVDVNDEQQECRGKDPNLELPSYAFYSKLPTAGRLVLPSEHQIPYTAPVPWAKKREHGEHLSPVKITATNSARSRCLDVDLDEDSGAVATYVPVTYQLPPTEEVRRRYYNTPVMNDIEDKLESVKDDITRSIGRLMRKGAPCHLCTIYDPEGTVTGAKLCEHFHDRQTKTNYATYDPHLKFDQDMEKLMRRDKPIIPLPRSYADSILDDDWEATNPILRLHNSINKRANAINVDSLTVRRDKPTTASITSPRSSGARGATRLLSRAATAAIAEGAGLSSTPIVRGAVIPMLPLKPQVRVPNYVPDRYPANHLLTRRKGYRYVSWMVREERNFKSRTCLLLFSFIRQMRHLWQYLVVYT